MTEGDIQREIFADLEKVSNALQAGVELKGFMGMDDESKQKLRKCLLAQDWHRYFLTLVREWQGTVSKEVAEAAEPDSTLFGAPPATVRLSSFPHADLSRTSLSQPSDLLAHEEKPFNRRHCSKRQSRVVFKQVCVALHDVLKLGDVMTALLSCVFCEILRSHCAIPQVLIGSIALQLMFLAGWVHRDISSGNLYWFEGNNDPEVRGILHQTTWGLVLRILRRISQSRQTLSWYGLLHPSRNTC